MLTADANRHTGRGRPLNDNLLLRKATHDRASEATLVHNNTSGCASIRQCLVGRVRINGETWAPPAAFTGMRETVRGHEHVEGHAVVLATFTPAGAAALFAAPAKTSAKDSAPCENTTTFTVA